MNRKLILNNLINLNKILSNSCIQKFSVKTPIIQPKRTFKIDNDKLSISQEDLSFNLTFFFSTVKFSITIFLIQQVKEQKKRNEEVQDMTELIRDFLDPAEFFKSVQTISEIDFF